VVLEAEKHQSMPSSLSCSIPFGVTDFVVIVVVLVVALVVGAVGLVVPGVLIELVLVVIL
jgi:hypothetical protein